VDVGSPTAIEDVVGASKPGHYHVDEICADPLPSGPTSRRWGAAIKHPDAAVDVRGGKHGPDDGGGGRRLSSQPLARPLSIEGLSPLDERIQLERQRAEGPHDRARPRGIHESVRGESEARHSWRPGSAIEVAKSPDSKRTRRRTDARRRAMPRWPTSIAMPPATRGSPSSVIRRHRNNVVCGTRVYQDPGFPTDRLRPRPSRCPARGSSCGHCSCCRRPSRWPCRRSTRSQPGRLTGDAGPSSSTWWTPSTGDRSGRT
jgi:hypothetical protein